MKEITRWIETLPEPLRTTMLKDCLAMMATRLAASVDLAIRVDQDAILAVMTRLRADLQLPYWTEGERIRAKLEALQTGATAKPVFDNRPRLRRRSSIGVYQVPLLRNGLTL